MKILVIGSGGREHAIVRALLRTASEPTEVVVAPGNAGIALDARCVAINSDDVAAIVATARAEAADLVVVGPEVPLVAGAVDALAEEGIAAFGPSAAAAKLEGSKVFSKQVMKAADVPTAGHAVVRTHEEALDQLASATYPTVMKADGLAAGKGVVICPDAASAREAANMFFLEQRFGPTDVVLEEHLVGRELSLLAICDGELAYPLTPARDFKRIFDGDQGPNTGGMGSFSPVPEIAADKLGHYSKMVHQPIVDELAKRGTPFHGILYAGLMLTLDGPKVLEYNTRFGDPETQAILPRLRCDLAALMLASIEPGGLTNAELAFAPEAAVTITLASAGYPESSSSGDVIAGLDLVGKDVEVTHAGTALGTAEAGGAAPLVTAGGRVLNVTALGETVAQARESAYAAAELITFQGRQMRTDIAAGI